MKDLTADEQNVVFGLTNMHDGRQQTLNRLRWEVLQKTGLEIAGKTIFEPGAGIGDQTEWLLAQGASRVIVNDGREANLSVIKKRFASDDRVSTILGNIENCLDLPAFRAIKADLVYLWGVYYHANDSLTDFGILRGLSHIAPIVVFDYLESATGQDWIESYDYDHPTTSISRKSPRPTYDTMMAGIKKTFGNAYNPVSQFDWHDFCAPQTPRKIAVGSKYPLNLPGLIAA
jgi:hypothetical protein